MGLNDPFIVRYVNYMLGLCQGDLGTSYKTRDPVGEEVWARLPNTAMLALTSTVVAILLALPLGIIAAIKQNTLFDGISMFISLLGISMPVFWMGLLLILFFSVKLGWFPVSGADQGIKSLVLPSIALGFMHMASIARTTRSSMLETIRQDYIRTVRAKGLPEKEGHHPPCLKECADPDDNGHRPPDRRNVRRFRTDRERVRMAGDRPLHDPVHPGP